MLNPDHQLLMVASLGAMALGPKSLRKLFVALNESTSTIPTEEDLRDHFKNAAQDDPLLNRFRRQLVAWDAAQADWTAATPRNTKERRSRIYNLLAIGQSLTAVLDDRLPFASWDRPIVVAKKHLRWYSEAVRSGRDFYWSHYREYLNRQGRFGDVGLERLDESTNLVVERLADPYGGHSYQAKGLVVGYVQSGKTANFTGVIAKAIDAGYRLIIVLSGTTNLLRNQTQRRIDRELVGVEQIKPADSVASKYDYASDPDWSQFISYGRPPAEIGGVDIIRLTGAGSSGDFQSLRHGIRTLQFEKRDRGKPLYHKSNLPYTGARLLIIKKNATVLERFSHDMRRIGKAEFQDVPALIIDDESDQASINTALPAAGAQNRTAINKHIGELLELLPRGQYVGYTATPFANVFVNPDDSTDIFPKDFLISLPRPHGYMGVREFHDFDASDDATDCDAGKSNEAAYVRDVPRPEKPADDRLQEAIDIYLLAGAVKLYRKRIQSEGDFKHHTMLVHETPRQADQLRLAENIQRRWLAGGYDAGPGIERLRKLFETDLQIVSKHRAERQPVPTRFDYLLNDIGEAIQRIEANAGPVYIVNGTDKANDPDFDAAPVWKIIVGGAKLSRGYTVEGLTVSYFRRRSTVQDTLMQMGRWFGFRPGYRDLVRLYIGRNEPLDKKGKRRLDLYELFEAMCRDEEAFRSQLARYAMPDDGSDPITPQQVPPLVLNSHPQLRPAAKNKMFNAVLTAVNKGGEWIERVQLADEHIGHNAKLFEDIIKSHKDLGGVVAANSDQGKSEFSAHVFVVPHERITRLFHAYKWAVPNLIGLELEFFEGKHFDPEIDDWILVLPQLTNPKTDPWAVGKLDMTTVVRSRVSTDGPFKAFSDPKHRAVISVLSGVGAGAPVGPVATRLFRKRRRGGILLYPAYQSEQSRGNPHMGLAILAPRNSHHALAHFTVLNKHQRDAPIVPVKAK